MDCQHPLYTSQGNFIRFGDYLCFTVLSNDNRLTIGNTSEKVIEEIANLQKCEENLKFGNIEKPLSTYAEKVRAIA